MEQIGSEYNFKTGGSIKALNDLIAKVEELDKQVNKLGTDTQKTGDGLNNLPKKTHSAAKGFDALGNSINQVTREFPAFAFSAQTGFLAVSNNIPILLDSINQLKQANIELAKEGKATIPVFKQVIASLFSWQTALSLLISFTVLYGKEIGNFIASLFSASDSVDTLTMRVNALNEAYNSKELSSSVKSLVELRTNLNLAKDGYISKEGVLKTYNEQFGKVLGTTNDVNVAEQNLIKATPALLQAYAQRAASAKLTADASDTLIEIQKVSKAIDDELTGRNKSLFQQFREGVAIGQQITDDGIKRAKEKRLKELKAEKKELEDKLKEQLNIGVQFAKDSERILLGTGTDAEAAAKAADEKRLSKLKESADKGKEILKQRVQDELNIAQDAYIKEISNKDATNETKEKAEIKLLESQIRIYEKYKKEDKEYAQSLLDVREKLAEKILGINEKSRADYLKGLQEEYKNDEALMQKTIDNQLDKINEDYASMKEGKILSLEEQRKLDLEHTQTLIAYLELVKDAGEKYSDKLVKLKEKESRLLTQINSKTNNEIVEDDEQRARRQEQIIMGISQTASSISSDLFDLRKSELEEETNIQIKELDKQKEAKIITEEQYEQKRKEILNKQARKQRELDLAEIQVKTALAVITAIALSPLTFGLPFSAFALAQGLAQYAFAASKPIPQFAKGTDRVIGGIKGKDSVHALLMPDEAVIPTKENLARPGLAKAWISGNLDNHLMMNYIKPAIDENNKRWEATLKVNQNSTFIRNDNFSDKKIVKTLEGIKRSLVKENKVVYKRNNRLWNLG